MSPVIPQIHGNHVCGAVCLTALSIKRVLGDNADMTLIANWVAALAGLLSIGWTLYQWWDLRRQRKKDTK